MQKSYKNDTLKNPNHRSQPKLKKKDITELNKSLLFPFQILLNEEC